jgi:hypothetical protein
MTLIKKRDVKDYFATRRLKSSPIHNVPASKPAAADQPDKERVPAEKAENASPNFDQDFIADHSSSGRSTAPKTPKAPGAFGRGSL